MTLVELIVVALALGVDAFTVGVAVGLTHRSPRQVFRLSFHFGLFQALMPALGAIACFALSGWIGSISHFIAFGLLLFIGIRMSLGALRRQGKDPDDSRDPTRGLSLIGLSIAVSIDALAVGFTVGLGGQPIAVAVILIGIVAGLMTFVGMKLAGGLADRMGRWAEFAAGIVLVGLGVKILLENL